jgi:hypothetical protein
MSRALVMLVMPAVLFALPRTGPAEDRVLHTFDRIKLTDEYYSEGANVGDLNHDAKPDAVYGPHWYEGPEFKTAREIYAPMPQNRRGYSDHFFHWVQDFNGDGWGDIFVVGFPGKPGFVYENPQGKDGHWTKHQVFDSVANESPQFTNIVGDERPELVCTTGGKYGFATIDWSKPFEKWTFHAISDQEAPNPFGHGLGVGDVNGDGRQDILQVGGWFEQPAAEAESARWTFHPASFRHNDSDYGGGDMHAYDVDGDGDNDVITSLAAHEFGLSWFEQDKNGDETVFREHAIVGQTPDENPYGLVITEMHALQLVDMDGDGLKDIVTGKTYWSHHDRSPMWDAGAVVYWFKLARTKDGVDWVPYLANGDTGIGRGLNVTDVNGDKLPDIVVGGMVGSSVLIHRTKKVSEEEWKKAQPVKSGKVSAKFQKGPSPKFDDSGKVAGVIEAEGLSAKTTGGTTTTQAMNGFPKDRWSGGKQLFWTGGKPGDRCELEFESTGSGDANIEAAFTMARDYAVIQADLDGEPLGSEVDLFNSPDVVTTGVLTLGKAKATAGKHTLGIKIVRANPSAVPAHMVGIDFIRVATTR